MYSKALYMTGVMVITFLRSCLILLLGRWNVFDILFPSLGFKSEHFLQLDSGLLQLYVVVFLL